MECNELGARQQKVVEDENGRDEEACDPEGHKQLKGLMLHGQYIVDILAEVQYLKERSQ